MRHRQTASPPSTWTAISMADDWKTIYGEGVKKTGLPGTEEKQDDAA